MMNKTGQTSQRTYRLRDELILGWTQPGDNLKFVRIIAPMERYSGNRYFQ